MSTNRVFLVTLLCSSAALVGCGSQSAVVPTSFAAYSSSEGEFACEYPEGWEAKGGGKHGRLWAKFASGSALIHIKSSIIGNLMSDAQRSASSVLTKARARAQASDALDAGSREALLGEPGDDARAGGRLCALVALLEAHGALEQSIAAQVDELKSMLGLGSRAAS